MSYLNPQKLPSIDEVFGHDPLLRGVVAQLFDTIVVPLLMPQGALVKVGGLGPRRVRAICDAIGAHGLWPNDLASSVDGRAWQLFGNFESSPIDILHIVVIRSTTGTEALYRPLAIIDQLSQRTVGELMSTSPFAVVAQLDELFAETDKTAPEEDVVELYGRLHASDIRANNGRPSLKEIRSL